MSKLYILKSITYGNIILERLEELSSFKNHIRVKVIDIEHNFGINSVHVGAVISYDLSLISPFSYAILTIPLIL
jgi:hypothetical protein